MTVAIGINLHQYQRVLRFDIDRTPYHVNSATSDAAGRFFSISEFMKLKRLSVARKPAFTAPRDSRRPFSERYKICMKKREVEEIRQTWDKYARAVPTLKIVSSDYSLETGRVLAS